MADANKTEEKWWLWGLISSAIVALGLDAWVKAWVKKFVAERLGPVAGVVIQQNAYVDKRAELLEDFRIMRKEGKNIDKLIQRHAKSMQPKKPDEKDSYMNPPEYLFVEFLRKIPCTQEGGRRETLQYLNDLEDLEFYQMLYLLEHDVVIQWIDTARRRGRKITGATINKLKELVRRSANTAGTGIKKGFQGLDRAAEGLALHLGQINDRLEAARTGGRS
ncbi:MAG TPA: hypothetical protein VMR99_02930 [Candidatus Paceibacterota bacterium]|nr:hypothetical protein [Candidatus Paceibacterota bacterium]